MKLYSKNQLVIFLTLCLALLIPFGVYLLSQTARQTNTNQDAVAAEPVTNTGASLTPPTEAEISSRKVVDSLLEKVPLETNEFIIDFDYRLSSFTVTGKAGIPDYQTAFVEWLNTSPYKTIPAENFSFQN